MNAENVAWLERERAAGNIIITVNEVLEMLAATERAREVNQLEFESRKVISRRFQMEERWRVICDKDADRLRDHLQLCKQRWNAFLRLEAEHDACPKSGSRCAGCERRVCNCTAPRQTVCLSIAVCEACDTFTGDLNPYNPKNDD